MVVGKRWSKKYILLAVVAIVSVAGIFFYVSKEKSQIYDFNYARDSKDILEMFDKDWSWLVADMTPEEYSADFMLRNRTPYQYPDTSHFGKLQIKVLRKDGKVAGFTAYWKENFYKAQILYVAVAREFRRQGIGKKLTKYAVQDLFKQNCQVIWLVTRTKNVARKLYENLGFKLYKEIPGFVYYELRKK